MANLTLNFADASFDGNDDYYINSDGLIYEMGTTTEPLQKKSGGDLTATNSGITAGAFTLGHNQDFYFEFEDSASGTDDYEINVVTAAETKTKEGVVAPHQHNSITMDVTQTDFDGNGQPDQSGALVNGENATVAVTRLDPHGHTIGTKNEIFGDGEVANQVSWVLSGDVNGSTGGSEDAGLAFRAGNYGGVFKGGDGFDTLVFDHGTQGPGTSQMYVGLDAGFAMFGGGVGSPMVQFAEIGASPYSLDWERLEMRGDSDDFVVVGGGLQGTDMSAAARALDTTNFFQIDLGSGADKLYVTDNSQSITLDLSATKDQLVEIVSSDKEFTIDVFGSEVVGNDHASLKVFGTLTGAVPSNPTEGVIDYIDFGDGYNNEVINNSNQGIAVNFGTADSSGNDAFTGSSLTDSDLIDLRGVDGALTIDDANDVIGSSIITIEASGNIEIEATDVDLLYVSQLDASGSATSDSDVLVNAESLYGSTGVLGQTITDVNGDGFDVKTSAIGTWSGSSTDIFYDGDHNAFTDTHDGLDRNATSYSVGKSGVNSEQLGWANEIQSDTGGSATPSFYIVVSGKKVPVYLDNTDPTAPQWKVDTTEFEVTSDAAGVNPFVAGYDDAGLQAIADDLAADHGVSISISALKDAQAVYLNASETDVTSLLSLADGSGVASMESGSAFDFGFYTQVAGTVTNMQGQSQTVYVNIGLDHTWATGANTWTIVSDDVHVKTDYNTVDMMHGTAVGGTGGDFIEMGSSAGDIAMGNAGNDAYIVGGGDDGIINEIGNLMGGAVSSEDSIQFELVNDMHELDFTRTRIAGEIDGSTLEIKAGGKGDASLFDQYNEFLSFRKTEYLVIDDGATADEVFELVTSDASGNSWENEVYVGHGDMTGFNAMEVDEGGIDHVYLGSGTETVNLDGLSAGDSVTIHGISGSDTVNIGSNAADAHAAETIVVTKGSSMNTNHVDYYDASGGFLGDEDLVFQSML